MKKNKSTYIIVLALASLITGSIQASPNIVLMVADDHGKEVLGAYGNAVIKTPNLDALARQGSRFENAYATTASCSASRSVLLTGLHNHKNGQYGHEHGYHHFRTFDEIKSLPVRLSELGYRTARVGKYHIGPEEVYRFDEALKESSEVLADGSRNTIGMSIAATEFVSKKSDKPFFLYLATNDPHRDHSFNSLGDNSFGNATDQGQGIARLDYSSEQVIVPAYLPDTTETRRELAELYQSVQRVDETLGHLVAQLKAAGVYDNTLIIYLSDNGTAMPGAKTTLYEPGINMPLLVKLPGKQSEAQRRIIQEMVSWPDITPTILDLAGAKPETNAFHGRSFAGLLTHKAQGSDWQEIYASHTFHEITMYYPMRMVRDGQFKLIWNIAYQLPYPFASDLQIASTWQSAIQSPAQMFGQRSIADYRQRAEFELFDLINDPNEAKNLATEPSYQATLQRLKSKLKAFQQNSQDPWVYKWDYQ